MENKYYTPSIEEFHVGFEYEHCHSSISFVTLNFKTGEKENRTEPKKIWEKSIFSGNEFDVWKSSFRFNDSLKDGQIRVKYLDKEDIESLGFMQEGDSARYRKENLNILFYALAESINPLVLTDRVVVIKDGEYVKYSGVIKNKSELIRILKMIGHGENL